MVSTVLDFLGLRVGGDAPLAAWLLRFTVEGFASAAVSGFSRLDFMHLPAEAAVSSFCSAWPLMNRLIPTLGGGCSDWLSGIASNTARSKRA
ncbi:MAG: hypothetical protein MUQ52_12010, partial [Pirellulales bacterium]|nr:hypothetical protein [Pirellulales bacterium]